MILDILFGRGNLLFGDTRKSFLVNLGIQLIVTTFIVGLILPDRCPQLLSRLKLVKPTPRRIHILVEV
uniref:Uncharacterized protein n=1 Tax=Rhizophora mucronata TaxID=61149 RepID=A0A2P2Q8H1_RHIMU